MAWTADLKTSHGKPTPQCQEMSYSADSKMENEDSQRPCEKPFTKALGTVSPWGVDKIFGGRYDGHQTAGWFINPGNYTPVPSHLCECYHRRYEEVSDDIKVPSLDSCDFTNNWPGGGSKTGLVETRVRMILCAILADRKRHGHVQNYRGTRILPSSAYESLQFQANKSVQLSWTYKNKSVLFIDTLSYCLQTAVDPNTVFVIDIRRRDRHDYDYMIACMCKSPAYKVILNNIY